MRACRSKSSRAAIPRAILLVWLIAIPLAAPLSAGQDEPGLSKRLELAEQVYREQGPEAALPAFQALADTSDAGADEISRAIAVGFVGEIHWRQGHYPQARRELQRAVAMKRTLGDRLQEGKSLNVLGLLYWDLGDFGQARAYFRDAAEIAAEVGDKRLQGAILNNLSLVNDEQGDYRTSLDQYRQVLELYKDIDFPRGESDTLGNIGGVYLLLGRFAEALSYYEKALEISKEQQMIPSMSQDHGDIALCLRGLGQTEHALKQFDEAIGRAVRSPVIELRGAMAHIGSGIHDPGTQIRRMLASALVVDVDSIRIAVNGFYRCSQTRKNAFGALAGCALSLIHI